MTDRACAVADRSVRSKLIHNNYCYSYMVTNVSNVLRGKAQNQILF